MKQNVGLIDRVVRVVLGLALIWVVTYAQLSAVVLWALTIIGLILIVTGLAGTSLLYLILNIDTNK